MAIGRKSKRSGPTEIEIWNDVCRSTHDPPFEQPSEQAVLSVLRRALKPDFQSAQYPDSWPDGDRLAGPTQLRGFQLDSISLHLPKKALTEVIAYAIKALDYHNGIEVCGRQVGFPELLNAGAISQALNRFPYFDSLVARYLAPLVRRFLNPPMTPSWYFRLMEEYRQSKRTRPALYPRGSRPWKRLALSNGYGWHRLELWALTACIAADSDLLKGGSTFGTDRRRLQDLVKHAAARAKKLVRRPPSTGLSAMEYEVLCTPLRRRLFWNASHPKAPVESRRFCRDRLTDLTSAWIPRIPPRERVDVWYEHERPYQDLLQTVREVWKESRDDGIEPQRKQLLEKRLWPLQPTAGDTEWQARLRRLWKQCGDLSTAQAHVIAAHILAFVYRLDVQPQRLRELLGKVDQAPPYLLQSSRLIGTHDERFTPLSPPDFL